MEIAPLLWGENGGFLRGPGTTAAPLQVPDSCLPRSTAECRAMSCVQLSFVSLIRPQERTRCAGYDARTHRQVLLERLQPLRDRLLRGRAVALQQVYESGLT